MSSVYFIDGLNSINSALGWVLVCSIWTLMKTILGYVTRASFWFALAGVLNACAPAASPRQKADEASPYSTPFLDYKPRDTMIYEKPIVVEKEQLKMIKGATRWIKSNVRWDIKNQALIVDGELEVSINATKKEIVKIAQRGFLQPDGTVALRSYSPDLAAAQADWSVGGKALCLKPAEDGNSFDCSKAVIDLFLRLEDQQIFQHQFEFSEIKTEKLQDLPELPTKVEPVDPRSVPDDEEVSEPEEEKSGAYEQTVTRQEIEESTTKKSSNAESDKPPVEGTDKGPEKDPGKPPVKQSEPVSPPKSQPPVKAEEPSKNNGQSGQLSTDNARVDRDQVIGAVYDGALSGGVNMLNKRKELGDTAGFDLIRVDRKRYYASSDLAQLIVGLGKWLYKWLKKYDLIIGDIAAEKGGRIGTHKSHQSGLDADIAYLFRDASYKGFQYSVVKGRLNSDLLIEANWHLFKTAVSSKKVDRIFLHRTVKAAICDRAIRNGEIRQADKSGLAFETLRRLIADTEHNSHFHLRIKCPPDQRRCRQMAAPPETTGCF